MSKRLSPNATPLITTIRKLFCEDLARENDFLRQENKILRGKLGKRVPLTEADRRALVRYGLPIRERLAEVISIVRPETLLAWHRRMKRRKWTYPTAFKRAGRPRTANHTEELVVRLAEENAWGYVRIAGELRKLGHVVSPTCVRALLLRHGLPPCPRRDGLSWKQFIQAHLDVAWAADMFTEEVWTRAGLVTFYVLFFVHLRTRRVHVAGCTPNPDSAWMSQQARSFCMTVNEPPGTVAHLIHDRDTSFLSLDRVLKAEGIKVIRTPPAAPQCNAFAERFVRECRETLNKLILIGQPHLEGVLKVIERHHNLRRPHQGLGNRIPLGYPYPDNRTPLENVRCESALGGLLNHYHVNKAA